MADAVGKSTDWGCHPEPNKGTILYPVIRLTTRILQANIPLLSSGRQQPPTGTLHPCTPGISAGPAGVYFRFRRAFSREKTAYFPRGYSPTYTNAFTAYIIAQLFQKSK